MHVRHRRALALVLLSSAFVSACGLKPEIKEQLAQNPGAVGGGGSIGLGADGGVDGGLGTGDVPAGDDGSFDAGDGSVADGGGDAGAGGSAGGGNAGGGTAGGGSGSAGGGSAGGGSGSAGGGGSTGGGGGAAADDSKGNRTGIDDGKKVVRIAVHGPLTGAGVPQESFRTGGPKYWQGKKLKNGYSVQVEAIDDKYNAPDALRACNAAERENFLLLGGAGTDQIQACAQSQVLRRNNMPYLSSGVTEAGLSKLTNYFATSLTYKQQGPLVVKMARDNGHFDGKWAVVITEGPNFADARQSIVAALQQSGAQGKSGKFNPSSDVYLTDKAPRDCSTLAGQLRGSYTSIYFLGQPAFFLQCVGTIGYQPGVYEPTYTGVGPSFGIQSVGNAACKATANRYKGFFLHPSPGTDTAQQRAGRTDFRDDIEYSIYAAMQGIHQALDQVPGTLTREKFIATLRPGGIKGGIMPPSVFRGQVFGGTAAFAVQADCGNDGRMKTLKSYSK
jgi:branched-chain amino acid transport system substrate-binding protein